MKIKLLSLVLLTLSLSLSACGAKVSKSTAQSPKGEVEDITRPPKIAASSEEVVLRRTDPNEVVSYEEWLKENSTPSKGAE